MLHDFLSLAVLQFFYHYFFDTPPKANNMFMTYFHQFFFTKNVLFSFKGAAKCLFFVKINSFNLITYLSFNNIFYLNRKILPFLKNENKKHIVKKNSWIRNSCKHVTNMLKLRYDLLSFLTICCIPRSTFGTIL